jgi:hypothetical protein
MRLISLWLVLSSLSFSVLANTQFNYDGFYARMKKSEKAEYSDITLAFLLQKQGTTAACDIDKALITTDISSEPLTLAANGELILPYSELLNNRKALIIIEQPAAATPCDLNFRLRSKMPLDAQISWAQLTKMHQQFQLLLQDLAGLGKYFLPTMNGVTLHFDKDVVLQQAPVALQSRVQCQAKACHIQILPALSAEQSAAASLEFTAAPAYLVPLLSR